MIPTRIEGCTRVLGAPAGWTPETSGPCVGLPIRDEMNGDVPCMVSSWEPTPAELEAFERDGTLLDQIDNWTSFGESVMLCLHELKRLRAAAVERHAEKTVFARLVQAAEAIGFQAGVGERETVGAIVSYLATSPDEIAPFVDGTLSPVDFAGDWISGGCLSWHARNGEIVRPGAVREGGNQHG